MTEIPTSTTDDPVDGPSHDQPTFDPPTADIVTDETTVDETADRVTEETETDAAADDESPAASTSTTKSRPRRIGNPVVWREMHTRFNSLGTAAVIAIFLVILGLPAIWVYATKLDSDYALLNLGRNGVYLFEFTLLMMLGLVMLIAPLQAASSIAQERDRQTLMPMQISLLRPWQIAVGKIRVAATFSMYLLLMGAPILAIAWTVGSVPVGHLIVGLLLLLVTILFATTVTVFCSSFTKRSIGAAFIAYVVLGIIIVGPSIGFLIVHEVDAQLGDDPVRAPKVMLATNPVMALATAVGDPVAPGEDPFGGGVMVEFDQFGNEISRNGPLSSLKQRLITEQDGVLGFNPGDEFGPDSTVVAFDGDVMFDQNGNPVFDAFGNPLPADTPVEFDEDGNMVFLDPDGNPIPTAADKILPDENGGFGAFDATLPPDVAGTIPPDAPGTTVVSEGPTDATAPPATVAVAINEFNDFGRPANQAQAASIPGVPLSLEYVFFVLVISALAAWGTARRLRTPAKTER